VDIQQRLGISTPARMLGTRRFERISEVDSTFGGGTAAAFGFQPGVFFDNEKFLLDQRSIAEITSIGISGGTDNTQYYATGSVENNPGIVRGSFFQRQSIRLNLDQRIGTKLSATLRTNVLHTKADRGLTNNDNKGNTYYVALSSTPSFVDLRIRPDGFFPNNAFAASNPLQTAALLKNDEDVWRFLAASTIQYTPMVTDRSSLRILATGGLDYFDQSNAIFSPPELQYEPGDNLVGASLLSNSGNVNLNLDANAVHAYSGRGFTATTSVGAQFARRNLNIARIASQNLTGGQQNVDAGTSVLVRQQRALSNTLGLFGQTEVLLLDNRLLLTAGIRADQTSANADAGKLFFYPKAAASYRFGNASGFVNELKFRAAYGQSGNEPLYGQRFTPLLSTRNVGGVPGILLGDPTGIPTVGNANLHYERQREVEVGVDGQLADSRLSFEATVYQKNITDLLLTRQLPPSSGFTQEIFNGGKLRTRGAEFAAGVVPIQSSKSSWYLRGTFALYRSKIVELPVPPFQTGGFSSASIGAFQIEEGKSATQIVGTTDKGTEAIVGDATPDFRVSFTNDLTWKAWSLHALLDWSKGGNVINLTELLYDAGTVSEDYVAAGAARFGSWIRGNTSEYIESATYVKLREVAVSYELPKRIVNGFFGATSGRLSFSGRNLLTSYPYRGLDPEVNNFGNQPIARGVDVGPYPPSRSFFFTVDIRF